MAYREPPFVYETVASPGASAITTAGTVSTKYSWARPFASGGVGASDGVGNLAVNDTFPYSLIGQTTGSTEMGIGTVTAISGSTITFTRGVLYSSNSNSAVNFTETCDLLVDKQSGVSVSRGAADANKPTILGANGVLDSSLLSAVTFFDASLSTSVNLATGTFVTIPLDTVNANLGRGTWDSTNYLYTVPSDGVYLCLSKLRPADNYYSGKISYGQGVNFNSNVDGAWFEWTWTATSVAQTSRNGSVNFRAVSATAGQQLNLYGVIDGGGGNGQITTAELTILKVR